MKANRTLILNALLLVVFYSCTPENPTPNCTFSYSPWTSCLNNFQTRSFTVSPSGCSGTPPPDSISRVCTSILSTPGNGVVFNGETYPSIVLGNGQEWMTENLRTTKYSNGELIPNVPYNNTAAWSNLNTGAWTHFNNDSQFENPYGKLYNWYTVADARNICPAGWHVPSDAEWTSLINYAGGTEIAGGKLKSSNPNYWVSTNIGATNETGFSGLPGGYRGPFGTADYGIGISGFWWSSTQTSSDCANNYQLSIGSVGISANGIADKNWGNSVRCVRD